MAAGAQAVVGPVVGDAVLLVGGGFRIRASLSSRHPPSLPRTTVTRLCLTRPFVPPASRPDILTPRHHAPSLNPAHTHTRPHPQLSLDTLLSAAGPDGDVAFALSRFSMQSVGPWRGAAATGRCVRACARATVLYLGAATLTDHHLISGLADSWNEGIMGRPVRARVRAYLGIAVSGARTEFSIEVDE